MKNIRIMLDRGESGGEQLSLFADRSRPHRNAGNMPDQPARTLSRPSRIETGQLHLQARKPTG